MSLVGKKLWLYTIICDYLIIQYKSKNFIKNISNNLSSYLYDKYTKKSTSIYDISKETIKKEVDKYTSYINHAIANIISHAFQIEFDYMLGYIWFKSIDIYNCDDILEALIMIIKDYYRGHIIKNEVHPTKKIIMDKKSVNNMIRYIYVKLNQYDG